MNTIIFVLGMHRSGTSLLASLLSDLGVPFGDDLIAGDENNAKGYFESQAIVDVHNELLAALGSHSSTSTVLKPFPDRWWLTPRLAPFKERLKQIAASHLRRSNGVWGFKDPRTARLLPLWKHIVDELAVDARYLFAIRHPQEVADSLSSRDRMTPVHAELLWLEHCADIVSHVGEKLGAIIDYDGWFENPHAQSVQVLRALSGITGDVQAAEFDAVISRRIDGNLRHQRTAHRFTLPFSRDLYDALRTSDLERAKMIVQIYEISTVFTRQVLSVADNMATAHVNSFARPV